MSYPRRMGYAEVNAGSMADIAFLLLTFFLMTTVIKNEKGLIVLLPQWNHVPTTTEIHQRNVFTIQINTNEEFLVEGKIRESLVGITEEIKLFVLNNNRNPLLSESPEKAIVSIKTDRGTSQSSFIKALDLVQAAYYEIYATRAGISSQEFRELDLSIKQHRQLYDAARSGIPMNISIAEPSRSGY